MTLVFYCWLLYCFMVAYYTAFVWKQVKNGFTAVDLTSQYKQLFYCIAFIVFGLCITFFKKDMFIAKQYMYLFHCVKRLNKKGIVTFYIIRDTLGSVFFFFFSLLFKSLVVQKINLRFFCGLQNWSITTFFLYDDNRYMHNLCKIHNADFRYIYPNNT